MPGKDKKLCIRTTFTSRTGAAYSTNIIALSRKKVGKTMDKVNDFKLAVTAVVALLTSLWGWFGWLVTPMDLIDIWHMLHLESMTG